jgi:redox-sensing transcriptional repressor
MEKPLIPRKSIYRFSLYSRGLTHLLTNKTETVSSDALAKVAGVKPTQLRKDLTYLGNFGRRGLGYNVEDLLVRINATLGTNRMLPVILIGVGNLGTALLSYQGFAKEGFELVAAFDACAEKIMETKKTSIAILPTSSLKSFVKKNDIRLAILAVPATAAQSVTNDLIASGIQAILNFSPILLQVPDEVVVNNVNLAIELENLAFFIR